jgi:hypothetical protein
MIINNHASVNPLGCSEGFTERILELLSFIVINAQYIEPLVMGL